MQISTCNKEDNRIILLVFRELVTNTQFYDKRDLKACL